MFRFPSLSPLSCDGHWWQEAEDFFVAFALGAPKTTFEDPRWAVMWFGTTYLAIAAAAATASATTTANVDPCSISVS